MIGFIASPAMNFIPGKPTRQDGLQRVPAGDPNRAIRLPDRCAPPEKPLDESLVLDTGPVVSLSVRPNNITLSAGDDAGLAGQI